MRLDPEQIEVMDDAMVPVLQAKTGAQRLQIASDMFRDARTRIVAFLTNEHPDWDEVRINREAARRLSHGAISP